jgi:7,8-dihydropterin-6-yl-methyl-4-(beta-D-ribofuranosyl)aminobenzene 5'-phosphate synthase
VKGVSILIIKTLLENRAITEDFETEHGISMYAEVGERKILFDAGASDAFMRNAVRMGVKLEDVDMMILSHGHYDHGGGIRAFMEINKKALVYIHKEAFRPHGSIKEGEIKDAGIDPSLINQDRVRLVEDDLYFGDELVLFSHIKGDKMVPRGNSRLLMEKDSEWTRDDFHHEQSLLLKEGNKRVLLVGCSHRGIVNILDQCENHLDRPLTAVIGGFHLYDLDKDKKEDMEFLRRIADRLMENNAVYYTGHCTGYDQFSLLKEMMGNRIHYLATGSIVEI